MSHRYLLTSLLIASILAGLAGDAWALRCERRLVSLGHTPGEVVARCGRPQEVLHLVEHRLIELPPTCEREGPRYQAIPVAVEQWVYDFGPHRLRVLLVFEGGRLREERSLGYGHAANAARWTARARP